VDVDNVLLTQFSMKRIERADFGGCNIGLQEFRDIFCLAI